MQNQSTYNSHIKNHYTVDYSQVLATTQISKVFYGQKKESKIKIVAKQIQINEKTNFNIMISQAKLLEKLEHPNIIKMYDYCYQNNVFSMYLQQCKLNLRNYQGQQMSKITILSYAKQIAEGMDYLHSKGILHLDLKPQNILVSYDYTVKIIDFGQSLYNKKTKFGREVKVTPSYCPSYILDISHGDEIVQFDEKFDVWSFGIIIYELYSKKCLFSGSNRAALKSQIKKFQLNQNELLNSEKIKDIDILDILKLTLKVDKNQRANFKQIKYYIQNSLKVATDRIQSKKIIQVKPTVILPDDKPTNDKKQAMAQSRKDITMITKYKDYMQSKIKQIFNFFCIVNDKDQFINCLPLTIQQVHLTIMKICLLAISNQLHYKLTSTIQSQHIVFYTPSQVNINVNNISVLYRTQHLNKYINQVINKYDMWKKEYREYAKSLQTILVKKKAFKSYESLIKHFNSEKNIFEILLFPNPERYISFSLRKYIIDIEKIFVNVAYEIDTETRDKLNQVAKKNIYQCSMICAIDRLLPENQFLNNEIYRCFNDLKHIEKIERDKETMRNILYSLDIPI